MTVELKVIEFIMIIYGLGWFLAFWLAKVQVSAMRHDIIEIKKEIKVVLKDASSLVTRLECQAERAHINDGIDELGVKSAKHGEDISSLRSWKDTHEHMVVRLSCKA